MSAARKVSRLAVGHVPTTAAHRHLHRVATGCFRTIGSNDKLPFGSRGGTAISHLFPADGEYALTVHLQKTLYNTCAGWPTRTSSSSGSTASA